MRGFVWQFVGGDEGDELIFGTPREIPPPPQMPANAQANAGKTWLLDPTTPRYAMSGFHITMDDTASVDSYLPKTVGFYLPKIVDAKLPLTHGC